jgi:hypothetical protein
VQEVQSENRASEELQRAVDYRGRLCTNEQHTRSFACRPACPCNDDLLLLAVDEVPLAKFNPDKAIDCWWNDKQRRPNQKKRNPYEQITSSSSTATSASSTERDITNADSDTGEDLLTEWDDCFK